MIPSDEMLMAYADGELDPPTRRLIEEAMAQNPELAQRVAGHQSVREALGLAFRPVSDEPIPQRLLAAARGASAQTTVVPLLSKRVPASDKRSWPTWAALAASFVLGAIVLGIAMTQLPGGPFTERSGRLVASGVLNDALTSQLSGTQAPQDRVRIGVSFRSRGGSYCRTFTLRDPGSIAGLACREAGEWRLQMIAQDVTSVSGSTEYRQASSVMPPALAKAVEETIAGDPLDSKSEAEAKGRDWKTDTAAPAIQHHP